MACNLQQALGDCAAWEALADRWQTCGAKVAWWKAAFGFDEAHARASVADRYAACDACRPQSAAKGATLPELHTATNKATNKAQLA